LIEAHKLLINEGHHHNLVIVGEGGRLGELTELARSLGVEKTVHFVGYQANPHAFIKRATVFALSSLFEGLPLVLVETLVCGTPIVSTDCPSGPDEILDGGKYGTLVPLSNPRALADGIADLLTDESKRRHLSDIGRPRGGSFDGNIKIKEWETMLTTLASQRA
jgi:glycosyltransferase involved in cell wall biosynthesis